MKLWVWSVGSGGAFSGPLSLRWQGFFWNFCWVLSLVWWTTLHFPLGTIVALSLGWEAFLFSFWSWGVSFLFLLEWLLGDCLSARLISSGIYIKRLLPLNLLFQDVHLFPTFCDPPQADCCRQHCSQMIVTIKCLIQQAAVDMQCFSESCTFCFSNTGSSPSF